MTETELELYKNEKLQKLFVEKMGPWRHGDPCWTKSNGVDFYCQDCLENNIFSPNLYLNTIRLPLPIDPVNPERGLWGMIDWTNFRLYADGGMWKIFKINEYGHEGWDIGDWVEPTEALLRALIAQIGG